MIRHLYIKNYALIDLLDIDLNEGFSVITGETGAGKSIILGALGLLQGNRADLHAIKEGEQRCVVEAELGDGTIIRREINANGKSRAFIDDSPVTLAELRELSAKQIDIHSQHQNLLLTNGAWQTAVVDSVAGNEALLSSYHVARADYLAAEQALHDEQERLAKSAEMIDFIRFQHDELAALNLQAGEDQELDARLKTMQHAEEIKSALYTLDSTLNDDSGVVAQLRRALTAISTIQSVFPSVEQVSDRLNTAYLDLKDLSGDSASLLNSVDYNPAEMERTEQRLNAIYAAQHKHRVATIDELLALLRSYKTQLENYDNSDEYLARLTTELKAKRESVEAIALRLYEQRRAVIPGLENAIQERLKPLALPNALFNIELKRPTDGLTDSGADFLFSANPGTPPRPIGEHASGGEIARVMLCIKALAGASDTPTLILDEIDTGVSGKVAEQMARMMRDMATTRQVISITHLPQIAASGEQHYKVVKHQTATTTTTTLQRLTDDERPAEIAQMLSGEEITTAALEHAKQLLGRSGD